MMKNNTIKNSNNLPALAVLKVALLATGISLSPSASALTTGLYTADLDAPVVNRHFENDDFSNRKNLTSLFGIKIRQSKSGIKFDLFPDVYVDELPLTIGSSDGSR